MRQKLLTVLFSVLVLAACGEKSPAPAGTPDSYPSEAPPENRDAKGAGPLKDAKGAGPPRDAKGGGPPRDAKGGEPPRDAQGGGPLKDIPPNTFLIRDEPERPTVFEAFEAPLAEIDKHVGERIQSMFARMEGRNWEQKGPALVVVRGDRSTAKVKAEVTFSLATRPSDAAEAKFEVGELPGGSVALGVHMGSLSNLAVSDAALDDWISQQGKTPRGEIRWYVFVNRPDEVGEANRKTLLFQPVQ